MNELLQRLHERRDAAVTQRKSIIDRARLEHREGDRLSVAEDAEFRTLTADIRGLDERIQEIQEEDQRSAASLAVMQRIGGGRPRSESRVYGPESRASYFADLARINLGVADHEARERMSTYGQEQRDLNRADGSGGFLVPPKWLMDQLVELARPGRVTADLLTLRPLPPGTDTISIPKIATGTAVAMQPADNDPVQEIDLTDTALTASVRTIAGQQDVALQLLDQSPLNFDEIVIRDLLGAHGQMMGAQVLSGTGTAGQLLGLRNVTGISTVDWTSGTPTAVEFQRRVADATQRISGALFSSPNAIVMHPRRWAWLLTQNDTSNRPLVLPDAYRPQNAQGLVTGTGEGRVGSFAGLPVYLDSGIPTNLGAGTNQDVILVLNTAETYLYESSIRTRVLQETLSGTLTARIQLYSYTAMLTRQPKSIAVISGTALVPPTFV